MSKLSAVIRKVRGKVGRLVKPIENTSFASMHGPFDSEIYSTSKAAYNNLSFPTSGIAGNSSSLKSCFCTKEQLDSKAFRFWASQIHERWRLHRKLWEFCYILQGLYERGMLANGRRGLGFAVGEEPLPSLMAHMGCTVMATDLDVNDPRATPWANTKQLTDSVVKLNQRKICAEQAFFERVSYRPVDMNKIPDDLRDFDYTWSSCSFEHCGSIELGKRFLREQMKCLKPGGVAIHTTEFNLTSNTDTIESGPTVIFRRQDVESMIRELKSDGHHVESFQIDLGNSAEDLHVDTFPYGHELHLKLKLFDLYTSTSVGLIIRKKGT